MPVPGDFDTGIRAALERLLVSPDFLFRIEADPAAVAAGNRVSSLRCRARVAPVVLSVEQHSRTTSCSIWRFAGKLREPACSISRCGACWPIRARAALVDNFFGQWLQTRNVWLLTPDANTKFPWFDDNLRIAFVRETELFLDDQLKADRGIVDLLTRTRRSSTSSSRATTVSGVYGSHFRRVTLADENRWGLLGKASVLAVTSYPTARRRPSAASGCSKTSWRRRCRPRRRNVNTNLDESKIGKSASVREMLEQHRANPVCASCHARMDPLGFSLENFDAIGQWRTTDGEAPIDATGVLLDGTKVDGPARFAARWWRRRSSSSGRSREAAHVCDRPGDGYSDAPAIRAIVRSGGGRRLPLVVDDSGDRQEHAVSDEEVAVMIVTKKAISRRPCFAEWARPWRCRCSTRWCRRSPRR